MVIFGVEIFLFALWRSEKFIATLFFSTKTIFLRHKVLSEYFFLSISETEKAVSIKFASIMLRHTRTHAHTHFFIIYVNAI